MFGNFIILASGFLASSPNCVRASSTCCSFGKISENVAKILAAKEISLVSKSI